MTKKLFSFLVTLWLTVYTYSQQNYYKDVDLNLTGIALKNVLATKIITTHTHQLFYTPDIWQVSKITGPNPNNSSEVVLFYGWENGIDTDISNDLYRNNILKDSGNGESFVWNREHVFAKSLAVPSLSTKEPGPGTDAHNLRPADRSRNSERSNRKFSAGSGHSKITANGGWYPGDAWKGDVARIIMYMYVRYNGNGSKISETKCLPTNIGIGSSTTTPDDMIDLFLQWNAEDPVSDLEKQRNTYHGNILNTYAQGNRNPFIDNPILATKIWGGPKAEDLWGTLNVSKSDLTQLKIYPNPTSINSITIHIPADLEVNSITLFSIIGSKIYQLKNPDKENTKIRIKNLKSGMYLLKITNNSSTISKKIVVN